MPIIDVAISLSDAQINQLCIVLELVLNIHICNSVGLLCSAV